VSRAEFSEALHTPDSLRHRSETVSGPLPPLLLAAEHLAATVLLGDHGRKRAGMGDEFWQYRPAEAGDGMRAIDWRRSARADTPFVREKEWQAAQSLLLWVDSSASMAFTGGRDRPSKLRRAQTLAMALSVLAIRAGERVALGDLPEPPRSGNGQLIRLAQALMDPEAPDEYGRPVLHRIPAGARAVLFSDFLGEMSALETLLAQAADRGVKGALVMVLDPDEEAFPFDGRTVFQSMSGTLRFETLKARGLRAAYLERLAARKDALDMLCRRTGWRLDIHHTDHPPEKALLWLYHALERVR